MSDKAYPYSSSNRVTTIGAYSVPYKTYRLFDLDGEDSQTQLAAFGKMLEHHDHLVGHNIKYDVHWLRQLGFDVSNKIQEDTLTNEYLLRRGEDTFTKLGLDKVAPLYGGTNKIDIIKKMWEAGMNTDEIPKSLLHKYLYYDVWNTYQIWKGQREHPQWERQANLMDMNIKLNSVTQMIEFEGMEIDVESGELTRKRFEEEAAEWERKVHELAKDKLPEGTDLKLSSPKQLSSLLYGRIVKPECKEDWKSFVDGYNIFRDEGNKQLNRAMLQFTEELDWGYGANYHKRFLTTTGGSSSAKAMEEMLKEGHFDGDVKDFINAFVEMKKRHTWLNLSYWSIAQNVSEDGRVHGSYNQAGTHTGRYSANNPNLLNLPSKKKNGGANDVRKMVKSRYGDKGFICDPDFSQIELRILFQLSQSVKGISDYEGGIDIHTSKAQWAIDHYFGEGTWEGADDKQRAAWRDGQKAVNFGLVYGLSPRDDLQKAMFEAFHNDYPEVRVWQEDVKSRIKSLKYYKSPITGFEYGFSKATHDNFYRGYTSDGRGWKNKALNFPVQGDAGRLTQLAMIGILEDIKDEPHIHMIGQVYDEILLDVHEDALDKAKEICLNNMNGVGELCKKQFGTEINIPIEATWSYGRNWFDTEEE